MEFGVVLPRYDVSFSDVVNLARQAEEQGFSSIWLTDHLQPTRGNIVLETWTLLSAVAALTSRARLGTTVLCHSYRHPSLLAKMASTLDQLSMGRLELGLGSGSPPQESEHMALGIEYLPPRERREQFREYVDVIKLLMTCTGKANYNGRYFKLKDASCNCPPSQKPHPPIWIGARRRAMLRVAAEKGDGWNFYGESLNEYENALREMENICSEIGRSYDKLRKALFTTIAIYRNGEERDRLFKTLGIGYDNLDEFYRRSFTLIHGDVSECMRMLERLEQLGVSLVIMRDLTREGLSIKVFAEEILPSYR